VFGIDPFQTKNMPVTPLLLKIVFKKPQPFSGSKAKTQVMRLGGSSGLGFGEGKTNRNSKHGSVKANGLHRAYGSPIWDAGDLEEIED